MVFIQRRDTDSKIPFLDIMDSQITFVPKKVDDHRLFKETRGSCPKLDLSFFWWALDTCLFRDAFSFTWHEKLHEWENQVLAHFTKSPDMAYGDVWWQNIFDIENFQKTF